MSLSGRPGLPVPNKPTVFVDVKQHSTNQRNGAELMTCVAVEVAVLGSPSLISFGFCGRKATLKRNELGLLGVGF